MKKLFPVYVRIPLLFLMFYGAMELFLGSGNKPAFVEHPLVLILMLLFFFVLIIVEITASSVNKVLNMLMTPEERAEKERKDSLPITESECYKKLMAKLTKSKSIEEEGAIELNHDYDGIKELDNDLPPWWVYLFYGTIIFSVVYLAKFHLFGGENQYAELEKEMEIARVQVEAYKKTAPDMLTKEQVTLLTEPADLAAGKALYDTNCVACHKADGGGAIGPNLTDEYWILGGDIKDIFNTIMEGGRDGKGMVPWKAQIKPSDIQKIASYIVSLQGTNPADAKGPEGDKYVAEAPAPSDEGAKEEAAATTEENKEEASK